MKPELYVLAWGALLGFVHIFAAGQAKTRQYGTKWNAGARDEALPPLNPVAGRLTRAQANFFETFPIVVALVAIVTLAGLHSRWTELGAYIWLAARIVYVPLYVAGVPVFRSIVFLVSVAGILLLLWPALAAGVSGSALFG